MHVQCVSLGAIGSTLVLNKVHK